MKHPFKVFSFSYTFFFTFLFFSLLFIVSIGIISYTITNQETVRQTIESRKLLLGEINKQLLAQMQAIEYDSLAISSNPKIINYLQSAEATYERVQQKREILDQISRLSYIKNGIHSVQLFGENIDAHDGIGTNGLYHYRTIESESWYDQIKNADSGWIGAHDMNTGAIKSDDNRVVSFARKVVSLSGKEVGILVINMKLSYMNQIIANTSPDDSRYIMDSYNRLITEIVGKKSGSFEGNNAGHRIDDALDNGNGQEYAISANDNKRLLIWDKQSGSNWVVVDAIAWDNVTKASRRIQNVILLAVAVCVVLAIGMALLLSRQFVHPIRQLIHVVDQVKRGRLHTRIENDYANEFGLLNEHFNLMIGRIESLLKEVEEQNRKKREAELQMLQEQINPHFIYNTLDTINWQAIEHGARDISRMLSLLGKMLRLGLSRGDAFITVGSEIEYLRCYIELQMIRYRNEVQISIRVPESIYRYKVPKVMLQPFIENALIHGLEGGKGGAIVIMGCESDSELLFVIADTGKGLDPDRSYRKGNMNGSGIRNVSERIMLYFGEPYGVRIESNPNQGTTVRIRIPKITGDQTEPGERKSC